MIHKTSSSKKGFNPQRILSKQKKKKEIKRCVASYINKYSLKVIYKHMYACCYCRIVGMGIGMGMSSFGNLLAVLPTPDERSEDFTYYFSLKILLINKIIRQYGGVDIEIRKR